jgi:hypothetical protein
MAQMKLASASYGPLAWRFAPSQLVSVHLLLQGHQQGHHLQTQSVKLAQSQTRQVLEHARMAAQMPILEHHHTQFPSLTTTVQVNYCMPVAEAAG